MGVSIARVTLHVGLGTFRPVKVDDVEQHHMHTEFYRVTKEAADQINQTKQAGRPHYLRWDDQLPYDRICNR